MFNYILELKNNFKFFKTSKHISKYYVGELNNNLPNGFGTPIEIEHYDNLHNFIIKLSNNKLNYNKLNQLNLDNPSDFPLENGGFDNLILNDIKKKSI
jgi:hypothetical protein